MPRVLLTGGAGFIGRHVHAELTASGFDVTVLDSLEADVHRGRVPSWDGLIVGDVRDPAACREALKQVDVVCHLAAKVGLGVDVFDLDDYADCNVRGTAVLLREMAHVGVGRFVQASSMVVYGEGRGVCAEHGSVVPGPRSAGALAAGEFDPPCPMCGRTLEPGLVDEDAELLPRNAYAASKVGQEHFASSWARLTGGSVASLRYHNVYGPGLPRDTPYAGVAALFLSSLRNGVAPQVFEDGGQRRDFVHVRDVARATAAAVRVTLNASAGVRVWNVGSGRPRTVGDLAVGLARAAGGPEPVITGQYRLGDVRHIVADSRRAREELNWRCVEDFDEGLADIAAADDDELTWSPIG